MAQERDYQLEDIIVLNTIRVARLTNTPWEDIRAMLKSGYREEKLPPEFADIYGTKAVYSDTRELKTQLTNANTELVDDHKGLGGLYCSDSRKGASRWQRNITSP